jgi:hypothetical protein
MGLVVCREKTVNDEKVDHDFLSRQFFAVLHAIESGEKNLLAVVQIPNEYGRTVRIDKALAAAASHLEASVPDQHFASAKSACQKVGTEAPSNKMNEIARAIFDALQARKK